MVHRLRPQLPGPRRHAQGRGGSPERGAQGGTPAEGIARGEGDCGEAVFSGGAQRGRLGRRQLQPGRLEARPPAAGRAAAEPGRAASDNDARL